MILVQTIGSVDMPGSGPRKMPAPRQYVAILVTWVVLQLVSGINAGAQRATSAIGWLLVLVGFVVGPFGKQVVNLFTMASQRFSAPNTPTGDLAAAEARFQGVPVSQLRTLTPFPPSSSGVR